MTLVVLYFRKREEGEEGGGGEGERDAEEHVDYVRKGAVIDGYAMQASKYERLKISTLTL